MLTVRAWGAPPAGPQGSSPQAPSRSLRPHCWPRPRSTASSRSRCSRSSWRSARCRCSSVSQSSGATSRSSEGSPTARPGAPAGCSTAHARSVSPSPCGCSSRRAPAPSRPGWVVLAAVLLAQPFSRRLDSRAVPTLAPGTYVVRATPRAPVLPLLRAVRARRAARAARRGCVPSSWLSPAACTASTPASEAPQPPPHDERPRSQAGGRSCVALLPTTSRARAPGARA